MRVLLRKRRTPDRACRSQHHRLLAQRPGEQVSGGHGENDAFLVAQEPAETLRRAFDQICVQAAEARSTILPGAWLPEPCSKASRARASGNTSAITGFNCPSSTSVEIWSSCHRFPRTMKKTPRTP